MEKKGGEKEMRKKIQKTIHKTLLATKNEQKHVAPQKNVKKIKSIIVRKKIKIKKNNKTLLYINIIITVPLVSMQSSLAQFHPIGQKPRRILDVWMDLGPSMRSKAHTNEGAMSEKEEDGDPFAPPARQQCKCPAPEKEGCAP